ncbi:hypothetical protein [Actinokineospora xionganensis]|uniref:Uncharacterized protein n=1 Tax=Actinokineospora xionganensis TaxID=2684470 RepID=A0ABR7LEV1_9PSEU|nr:hypothetical protein [Actinokineospora xionganensis]MBC6451226.1 hypothetical protein [Actinokineospora xionganensis]
MRWYRQSNNFCLPYETRRRIGDENLADETLRLTVLAGFEDRIRELPEFPVRNDAEIELAAQVMLRALQFAFETEGLEFAHFLEDKQRGEYPTIADSVRHAIDHFSLVGKKRVRVATAVMATVRRVLYSSQEHERVYLSKLSRTYALLFTLNTEPRLIDFFQDMTGDLRLYVGADVLVRALSEHCLAKEDQATTNTLEMASRCGAELILTEPALDEVVNNLRGTDREYKNHYKAIDAHVDLNMTRNVSKIMLRAYFYARLDVTTAALKPRNWESFVGQFCDYTDLHTSRAMDDMRRYLQTGYNLSYEAAAKMRSVVNDDALADLTRRLLSLKGNKYELALNDALTALTVYGKRLENREDGSGGEFGYRTWWLTGETAIARKTGLLVKRNNGARYMMRPDFLLNFLALAPSTQEIRETFGTVFPSLLGVTLSKRMSEESFKEIMDKVRDATELSEARRSAQIAKLSDQLKSDFVRQYANSLEDVDPNEEVVRAALG